MSITCRTGISTGALRSHPEKAPSVNPRNRTATRANRSKLNRRKDQGKAKLNIELCRVALMTTRDDSQVTARPSHIKRDKVASGFEPEMLARHHATGEPRKQQLNGLVRRFFS